MLTKIVYILPNLLKIWQNCWSLLNAFKHVDCNPILPSFSTQPQIQEERAGPEGIAASPDNHHQQQAKQPTPVDYLDVPRAPSVDIVAYLIRRVGVKYRRRCSILSLLHHSLAT